MFVFLKSNDTQKYIVEPGSTCLLMISHIDLTSYHYRLITYVKFLINLKKSQTTLLMHMQCKIPERDENVCLGLALML